MTLPLTVPPRQGLLTFMDFPLCTDLDALEADVAIIGMPYGDPYTFDEGGGGQDQIHAPTAVRAESARISVSPDQYDFDLGGTMLDGKPVRVVDCGDVPGDHHDFASHYPRAEAAARKIIGAGAMIITIGGDHGVPIPVFRAFEGHDTITLVHVDAHLDWRDEVNGATEGYSSPIRRAAELDWFGPIIQIGLRGQGSARTGEVRDAEAYGADLIPAHDLHAMGMAAVLDRIPDGGPYYLTVDADGLDPTEMPAVAAPVPGGVSFQQMRTLIHGLVAKGPVLGMDIVEITPSRDVNGITSLTAGRLIVNLIGAATRTGQFTGS
ncbi:MAG: agmatinase [Pseudomonadota bacterium]|nr:agmatinase [Pseudomonadota bacterium]